MRKLVCLLGVVVLGAAPVLFGGNLAGAQIPTCPASGGDFLTGGGFIVDATVTDPPGSHANFGVGGSCKKGGGPHGLWGHLEYIDHGMGLNVHWTTITAYLPDPTDPNARFICGTARTNLYGDVNFAVRAADDGQPGKGVDQFDIILVGPGGGYSTSPNLSGPFHTLVGGNIVLHKPNPAGPFGGSCAALNIGD